MLPKLMISAQKRLAPYSKSFIAIAIVGWIILWFLMFEPMIRLEDKFNLNADNRIILIVLTTMWAQGLWIFCGGSTNLPTKTASDNNILKKFIYYFWALSAWLKALFFTVWFGGVAIFTVIFLYSIITKVS
ncbi:hypothetical protein [Thalassomonas haliotis]|uniref:Uncharacterized protein n=1 Tax=Thalassomonas haliotis TaxID=485448 RepID=A0ABY7V7X7_9GAMM|nr:hypothetical protein [Thalassomonas haliotis]WDE09370.1 hypothetical protein H3N35_13590 [Thalassomonas haliotis]